MNQLNIEMHNITIDTEDKSVIEAVRALLKGYGVSYSESPGKSPYSADFVKRVKDAETRIEKGEYIEVDPGNLWESIESGLKTRRRKI